MKELKEYKKDHAYVVCIDSDGCAMDTMNIKHFKCFGPCMVKEWQLEHWQDAILKRWNEINLFTMTRGINRFKGLALALTEISEKYQKIDGIAAFRNWADHAPELSNDALSKAISLNADPIFTKALNWSKAVNAAINALPQESKKPFAHVEEALKAAHEQAAVAIVSSANKEAVVEEWNRCGLADSVDVMCCQDAGSKAYCLSRLVELGYAKDHVLMVGDAPGDLASTESNDVLYYPILVNHEAQSWQEFIQTVLPAFMHGTYEDIRETYIEAFKKNLGE